jgi:ATP-dependent DNA helicase DinG
MEREIDRILGAGGLLSQRFPGYEIRPQQLEMARTMGRAFQTQSRALVEAGTGTGKTLAYLVPAVLSGKRTLVSTATKNLQEQIFYKDVPLLRELGLDVPVAYLKGRSNYLCKLRYQEFQRMPLFRSTADARHGDRLFAWAETTATGDRAELAELPDDFATWADLSTGSEGCLGRGCPLFEQCFVTKVRREAAQAAIIVVNHHLFFADLAVRDDANAEVLPEVQAVVFDEAHHLEESASSFFGRTMSPYRLRDLSFDLQRALRGNPKGGEPLTALVAQAERPLAELFALLQGQLGPIDRVELATELSEDAAVRQACAAADTALGQLERQVRDSATLGEMAVAFARRVAEIRADLTFLLGPRDHSWVYFAEQRGRRDALFLQASPIDLSEVVQSTAYP